MVKLKRHLKKLAAAGLCIAIALLLPLLTGQIPQVGSALCPMHIPVLICGFVCGWPWGLIVGFISPLLRSALFGMPPMYPTAVAMAFELAAYGAFAGMLYARLPKKTVYIYVALIAAMILGRAVWGAARFVMAGLDPQEFPFSVFLSGAVITAIPGIICHIIIIPLVVLALRKGKFIYND